jgi:dipeptidyl-peptidase 4
MIIQYSFSVISIAAMLCLSAGPALGSAGTDPQDTVDYAAAERFLDWNTETKIYGGAVTPTWGDGNRFWYRNRFSGGFEFIYVDPDEEFRARAFDHERLAASLSNEMSAMIGPFDLPFTELVFSDDMRAIRFTIDGVAWVCVLENYRCAVDADAEDAVPYSVTSPDGRKSAYIRDYNLWMHDRETGRHIRLTGDGVKHYGYATDSQGWTRSESPILLWSPDSRMIATYRLDERGVGMMPLIETMEGRPALHYWPYALPGDTVVPMLERVVIHTDEPRTVRLNVEPDHQRTSNCCGLTRNGAWADVEWRPDSALLAFVSTSRDYKTVRLRISDPYTGDVREVYEERAGTFFESNLNPRGIPNWRVLHERNEFIWFTRRDEWGHLYLHDLDTGEMKRRITSGSWNVIDILSVDETEGDIYFTAVGREEGRDPYYRHVYRVRIDGGDPVLLTAENADHEVHMAPSGRFFVDSYSTFDSPPVSVVRRRDGSALLPLEAADISGLQETGWEPPIPFTVKGRDGETELYGVLFLPTNFDPEKKYPMINSIYPGPQVGGVGGRSFTVTGRGQTRALAELGFIVVQIDATGSPFRSKSFHTHWYGDMGDNGLEDQIAAMRQLAGMFPWIDADRVGIYGHSGGGYAAAGAMLRYPDFFRVGVASAGNHDNRGYTYYWGEKYQGLLDRHDDGSDSYASQANHPLAEKLSGKLLVTYGTMDANVHPNTTLLLIHELIRHNKDFDVMVFPNRGHGYFNEPYNIRLTWDYFVRHLLDKQPPAGYRIVR